MRIQMCAASDTLEPKEEECNALTGDHYCLRYGCRLYASETKEENRSNNGPLAFLELSSFVNVRWMRMNPIVFCHNSVAGMVVHIDSD